MPQETTTFSVIDRGNRCQGTGIEDWAPLESFGIRCERSDSLHNPNLTKPQEATKILTSVLANAVTSQPTYHSGLGVTNGKHPGQMATSQLVNSNVDLALGLTYPCGTKSHHSPFKNGSRGREQHDGVRGYTTGLGHCSTRWEDSIPSDSNWSTTCSSSKGTYATPQFLQAPPELPGHLVPSVSISGPEAISHGPIREEFLGIRALCTLRETYNTKFRELGEEYERERSGIEQRISMVLAGEELAIFNLCCSFIRPDWQM